MLADMELKGEQAPADKLKWLQTNHALVEKQNAQMARLSLSYAQIQGEFAETLEKYRQMKGIAPPAEATPPSPATSGKS
jgi:hypothetical protein